MKAKRAQQRMAEQRAHEKNVRTGKYKPKKAAAPAEEQTAKKPEQAPQQTPQRPARRTEEGARPTGRGSAAGRTASRGSRPSKGNRPAAKRPKYDPYAHSRPVKKGKGSFRKKED